MELDAHRQQRCDPPIRYVLIQNKDKLGGLNQINLLRIFNLLALIVESIAFFNIIYYLPAFVFIAFHFLGFMWSFLYQIFPSLSTSLVFKLFAHLFSTVYMMVGIINTFFYINATFSRDKEFFLWLLVIFSGPTAIVSMTLLLLMNLESLQRKESIKKQRPMSSEYFLLTSQSSIQPVKIMV